MSRRIKVCATVLLVLFELTMSAMVLPRPPSSPNHIRQDQELSARKSLEGKSLHGVVRNTNVERPDTEDYRYIDSPTFARRGLFRANIYIFFFSYRRDRYRYYIFHGRRTLQRQFTFVSRLELLARSE